MSSIDHIKTVPVVTNTARTEKTTLTPSHASEKTQREANAAQAPAAQTSKVTVSPAATAARQVSVADVDQKKVDSVRSAIEKKTFKVNAEAIADKMLANAEEMLKRKEH